MKSERAASFAPYRAILLGGMLVGLGCSEGSGPSVPCGLTSPCSNVALQTLTLTPKYDTLLVGDTAQIVFAATNKAGQTITNVAVKYSTSKKSILTVDTTGGVHAVGAGTATLTIAAGGLTASSIVTVLAPTVVQVHSGADYSCLLLPLGRGYCWGLDNLGQLAAAAGTTCFDSGATPTSVPCSLTPIAMSGGIRFTTLTTGGFVVCGLNTATAAFCWGDNTFGELGNGTTGSSGTPLAVVGGLSFTEIAAGDGHVCAIATNNSTYCWGSDSTGQLGDTGIVYSTTPVPVSGGGPFVAITAGGAHTCGLLSTGAAYCWGGNAFGELGIGTPGNHSEPVAVAGGLTFTAISASETETCGLITGGAAYCWGNYGAGSSPTPAAITGGLVFTQISSGPGYACGLSGTAVYCWGFNNDGQLGDGSTGGLSASPVEVTGGLSFASVAAGFQSACGRLSNGTAACWGSNVFGALGNSQQVASSPAPVIVGSPLN